MNIYYNTYTLQINIDGTRIMKTRNYKYNFLMEMFI